MPLQPLRIECLICVRPFDEKLQKPISLSCGHTVCKSCVKNRLKDNRCPFDNTALPVEKEHLPLNLALMDIVGLEVEHQTEEMRPDNLQNDDADQTLTDNFRLYRQTLSCIEDMTAYLKPLVDNASDDDDNSSISSKDDYPSENNTSLKSLNNLNDKLTSMTIDNHSNSNPAPTNIGLSSHPRSKVDTRNTARLQDNQKHINNIGVNQHQKCYLSRPMQRKLISLDMCQLLEEEGRSRSARIARSLGERMVTELLVLHQFPHLLSSNLWAAVRTRGCQFLGPAMQEEVLKLILLALEDGSSLSRKVLVLFVVQKLEVHYPQASKTAIGHVVQLLYRASCFKVHKREGESSLMQLKEEFRQYEALRREHDSQVVQIALEAGLRISPEQWSSLLYGDVAHKPHMQSVIDKHQSPQSFAQNISELMLMLHKNFENSPWLRLRPHLEFLASIDPSPDCPALSWHNLEAVMRSLSTVMAAFIDCLAKNNSNDPNNRGGHGGSGHGLSSTLTSASSAVAYGNMRYKTSMCRDLVAKGNCPRGAACSFAHSQAELERYRLRSRNQGLRGSGPNQHPVAVHEKTTSSLSRSENDQLRHVQLLSKAKESAGAQVPVLVEPGGMSLSGPVHQQAEKTNESQGSPNSGSFHLLGSANTDTRGPPQLKAPTNLTFSRPALDGGKEPSQVLPQQQASLHPNNAFMNTVAHSKPCNTAMPPPPSSAHLSSSQTYQLGREQDPGFVQHHYQQPFYHQHHLPQMEGGRHYVMPGECFPVMGVPAVYGADGVEVNTYYQAEPLASVNASLQQQQQQPNVAYSYDYQQQRREAESLDDLCQRKQDIIQHLKEEPTFLSWHDPTMYQADARKGGFHSLNTVINLNKCKQEPMPKPVSDTFVATRSTKSLDKLVPQELPQQPKWLNGEDRQPCCDRMRQRTTEFQPRSKIVSSMPSSASVYAECVTKASASALLESGESWYPSSKYGLSSGTTSASLNSASYVGPVTQSYSHSDLAFSTNGNTSSPYSSSGVDSYQTTFYNSLVYGGVTTLDNTNSEFSRFPSDDSDNTIPFEETSVSKFGPISRVNKTKTAGYPGALQVTADSNQPLPPVDHGLNHNLLRADIPAVKYTGSAKLLTANIPDGRTTRARLVGEPAVKPTALEKQSIWDESPHPSYRNIAQLMAGAAEAVSNNEKLAYQLQAVELEISMKTGREPQPVGKMIQAAVGPSNLPHMSDAPTDPRHGSVNTIDMDYLERMRQETPFKTDGKFGEWDDVWK